MSQDETALTPSYPWTATVVTLWPDMFPGPMATSLAGRGLCKGLWSMDTVDIHTTALGKHKTVDEAPYGGGAGMIMRADVLGAAIEQALERQPAKRPLIYLSPRGRPLTQEKVHKLAQLSGVILICGRFEGVDQRVIEDYCVEEISAGDYILSGGEIAALVMLDACVRVLPGIVGTRESLVEESFEQCLLEHDHYTRPRSWRGRDVPEVLLSGDHQAIRQWRLNRSQTLTKQRRHDLWTVYNQRRHDESGGKET